MIRRKGSRGRRSQWRLKRRRAGWAATDEHCAEVAGFYLGNYHRLIHRHMESFALKADDTGDWSLKVDFELPTDPEARCSEGEDGAQFLFPLMLLRKAEGRIGFYVRDENGNSLPVPTRANCDWTSAVAAAEAAKRIARNSRRSLSVSRRSLSISDLRGVFAGVCRGKPYDASVTLTTLLHGLDPKVVGDWDRAGLTTDLYFLIEHSFVWLPIRGRPGERRVIEVGHASDLSRRAILRWSFGAIEMDNQTRRGRRRSKELLSPESAIDTGKAKYGRRAYRISLRALGERFVRPLAWVPIQCEFPTIYTRRCDSYHFELTCPSGLSPRDVRVTTEDGREKPVVGRRTLRTRAAHLYLPDGRDVGGLKIRVTVGIGGGAFPVLWFLSGALTSLLLWIVASANPHLLFGTPQSAGRNEIAAGILLTVPAVLGALVVVEEGAVARMVWGARILLFVPALCSVVAASVLIGDAPFNFGSRSMWTACAAIATAATVPLATSWLISSPLVWRQLKKLSTPGIQYVWLSGMIALAAAIVLALKLFESRAAMVAGACLLLALTVPLLLLATNRASIPILANRRYVAISASAAAAICLGLGCIELRAAFDPGAEVHRVSEWIALPLLVVFAPLVGPLLALMASPFKRKPGEIHISPEDGRRILARESISEIRQLREEDQKAAEMVVSENRVRVDADG